MCLRVGQLEPRTRCGHLCGGLPLAVLDRTRNNELEVRLRLVTPGRPGSATTSWYPGPTGTTTTGMNGTTTTIRVIVLRALWREGSQGVNACENIRAAFVTSSCTAAGLPSTPPTLVVFQSCVLRCTRALDESTPPTPITSTLPESNGGAYLPPCIVAFRFAPFNFKLCQWCNVA